MKRAARLSCLLAPVLMVCATALPASAQWRPAGDTVSLEDQKKAQDHFQRARELYLGGSYREAIAELEIARKLDPKAKDLVMNLGILHEKLGKYDEAIAYLRSYLDMEGVSPTERAKVETMVKRVEGAKQREAAARQAADAKASTPVSATTKAPEGPEPMGRVDGFTIGAAAVAGVGIAAGTVLGVVALSSRPEEGFVTGRDGSYDALKEKAGDAHTVAIFSDVGFGVAAVALVATAILYFGRTKAPAPSVSAGSRTLFLSGTF